MDERIQIEDNLPIMRIIWTVTDTVCEKYHIGEHKQVTTNPQGIS
jgi:hypothetical protein